jgi:hypothetical protein
MPFSVGASKLKRRGADPLSKLVQQSGDVSHEAGNHVESFANSASKASGSEHWAMDLSSGAYTAAVNGEIAASKFRRQGYTDQAQLAAGKSHVDRALGHAISMGPGAVDYDAGVGAVLNGRLNPSTPYSSYQ